MIFITLFTNTCRQIYTNFAHYINIATLIPLLYDIHLILAYNCHIIPPKKQSDLWKCCRMEKNSWKNKINKFLWWQVKISYKIWFNFVKVQSNTNRCYSIWSKADKLWLGGQIRTNSKLEHLKFITWHILQFKTLLLFYINKIMIILFVTTFCAIKITYPNEYINNLTNNFINNFT